MDTLIKLLNYSILNISSTATSSLNFVNNESKHSPRTRILQTFYSNN